MRWNEYIRALQSSHIRLVDREDSLVWTNNVTGGLYTPRLGYLVIREEEKTPYPPWWALMIWKFKCPIKSKLFLWLVISQRVPFWDLMIRHFKIGPGWCPLCRNSNE